MYKALSGILQVKVFLVTLLFINTINIANASVHTPSTDIIHSKVLNEDREIVVHLPASYEKNKRQKYPVLYVLDGLDNLSHTSGTSDFLSHYNNIPELIVVAIASPERYRDFTPTGPEGDMSVGGGDRFLDFVEQELMVHIDKNYRNDKFNMIAGHSLGGLLVIYSLQSRSALFQAHFAFSPSLWWDEQLIVKNTIAMLAKTKALKNYLYINLGDESERMKKGFDELVAAINQSKPTGFTLKAEHLIEETHTTTPVIGQFKALRTLYAKWKIPNSKYPEGLAAIDAYYKSLSSDLGYSIPTPETVINNLGNYYLRYAKDNKKAIEAFARNVKDYPESSATYANLAVGYEHDGQIEKAIGSFDSALKSMNPNDATYNEYKSYRQRLVKQLAGAKPL